MPVDRGQDIKERTFNFTSRAVKLVDRLPKTMAANVLGKQLIRAGTSVGANCEETHASYRKDAFVFNLTVALREDRETHY